MAEYVDKQKARDLFQQKCYNVSDRINSVELGMFVDGIMQVLDEATAADVQPAKQWISVKDRQPQKNGFYLTYYSKQIHVSQWFISANWYNEHGGNVTNNVEYWQPLPKPPKDGDING